MPVDTSSVLVALPLMVLPALQPVEEGAVLTLAGMMHVLDSRVKCVRMIAHAWVSRGAIMHASHMLQML